MRADDCARRLRERRLPRWKNADDAGHELDECATKRGAERGAGCRCCRQRLAVADCRRFFVAVGVTIRSWPCGSPSLRCGAERQNEQPPMRIVEARRALSRRVE